MFVLFGLFEKRILRNLPEYFFFGNDKNHFQNLIAVLMCFLSYESITIVAMVARKLKAFSIKKEKLCQQITTQSIRKGK